MKYRAVTLGIAAFVLVIGTSAFFRQTPTKAQPPGAPRAESTAKRQLVGATSCSASVCHGGADLGQLRSEATTWRALDPHARAYESLLSARSKAMAQHMWNDGTQAHDAPLCLKCHVHPEYDHARPNFRRQDGVGCESCHGAAQDWLTPHYRPAWQQADKKSHGMADTKSLPGRASICVRCHVGTPDANVDHDMIAAGHPALRFEYSSYFANLPPHWRKLPELTKPKYYDFIAWAIGQDVSAAAAAELLAHRTKKGQAWPEFAELSCFSCHHDLHSKSWRQSKDHLQLQRPGQLQLGSWYTAMSIVTHIKVESPVRMPMVSPILDPIRDREKINLQATEDAAVFRERSLEFDDANMAARFFQLRQVAQAVNDYEGDLEFGDGFAQLYLALLASETKKHDELINRLHRALVLPPGYASPHRSDPGLKIIPDAKK